MTALISDIFGERKMWGMGCFSMSCWVWGGSENKWGALFRMTALTGHTFKKSENAGSGEQMRITSISRVLSDSRGILLSPRLLHLMCYNLWSDIVYFTYFQGICFQSIRVFIEYIIVVRWE